MDMTIGNVTLTGQRNISLDNEKLRRANAKPTANVAYHVGDLLTLSADNVLTHATDEKTWNVICALDVPADDATTRAANNIEVAVFIGGVFDVKQAKLNGTALTTDKYAAARATASLHNIELLEIKG